MAIFNSPFLGNREMVKGRQQSGHVANSISIALGMLYLGAVGLLGYCNMDVSEVLNFQQSQIKNLHGLDPKASFVVSNAQFYNPSRILTNQDFLEKNSI